MKARIVHFTSLGAFLASTAFLFPLIGQQAGTEARKLSAREIFYSAPKVAKKKASRKPSPPAGVPSAKPAPQPAAAGAGVDIAVTSPPKVQPPSPPPEPEPQPEPVAPTAPPPAAAPGGGQFVPASLKEAAPIGIRCSVLRRIGPSDLIEVDPDQVFRAGDRIKLRVEANEDGYLYVIARGSSGVWKPLFPSPQVAGGNNFIEAGRTYDIPPGHVFTFDEQPGEEKLFVVFSRTPVTDLEALIYDLGKKSGEPSAAPEPAKPAGGGKVLLAQNMVAIRDDVVSQLRNAYARDLIIEKVSEAEPGPEKEAAIYAVSTATSTDSRVVLDLTLLHR